MGRFSYVMNPVTDEVKFAKDLKDGDMAVVQGCTLPEGRTGQMHVISQLHPDGDYLRWVGTFEDGYRYGFTYGRHVPFIVRRKD